MIPIYKGTAKEAIEKGEIEQWRQSQAENVRCRKAIEESIRQHFDGWHLENDIHLPIIEEFGLERVNHVLAATLENKVHDGRFSRTNRDWAAGLGIPFDENHMVEYVVNSHPAVLDGFIDMVRSYNAQHMTETAGDETCEAPTDSPDEDDGMVMQ